MPDTKSGNVTISREDFLGERKPGLASQFPAVGQPVTTPITTPTAATTYPTRGAGGEILSPGMFEKVPPSGWLEKQLIELQDTPWEPRWDEIKNRASGQGFSLPDELRDEPTFFERWQAAGTVIIEHPVSQALSALAGIALIAYGGYAAWQMFGSRISQPIQNMFTTRQYNKSFEAQALRKMAGEFQKGKSSQSFETLNTELRRAFDLKKQGNTKAAQEIVERIRQSYAKFDPGVAKGRELVVRQPSAPIPKVPTVKPITVKPPTVKPSLPAQVIVPTAKPIVPVVSPVPQIKPSVTPSTAVTPVVEGGEKLSITGKQVMAPQVQREIENKLTTFAEKGFNIENMLTDYNNDLMARGFSKGEAEAITHDALVNVRQAIPQPTVTPEVTPTKEPWQMTKDEVYEKAKDLLTPGAEGRPFTAERLDLLNKQVNYHKTLVEQALAEGKQVPAEVLKDYPTLVKPTTVKPAIAKIAPQIKPVEKVVEGITPQAVIKAPEIKPVSETIRLVSRRDEIGRLLATPMAKLPAGTKKIELRQELAKINKALVPAEKKLRQQIMATAIARSISPVQRTKIFKDIGGSRHLSEIGLDKLEKILPAIQKARPIRIKSRTVITKATEDNIQSLKKTLIASGKFTDKAYAEVMSYLKLRADKFTDINDFITETEGKAIIKLINQRAETGLIEWDNKVAQALANKPELAKAIGDIKGRIETTAEVYENGKPVGISPLWDMEVYVQRLQERTGVRIYDIYERSVNLHLENDIRVDNMDKVLMETTPLFKKIAKDPEALVRINQYIAAKNKLSGFETPKDITPDEILIAKQIEKDLLQFVPDVRFSRFYNSYHAHEGNVDKIKADIPNAPMKDIKEAIDIYESGGYEALYAYLEPKDWGVILEGYEPHIAMNPKLQLTRIRSSVVGKGRLKTRHELDFSNQDRDILQRRKAYIRQMFNLKLEPYFKEMDRLFIEMAPKLKNSGNVAEALNMAMQEMKGYVVEGTLARLAMRLAGWSFSTLSLSPHMFFRNMFQNPALHPDMGAFLNPANKTLTDQQMLYLKTYVSQFKGVVKDWLLQEGMGNTQIEQLLKKITYYGKSDEINRIASFWGSYNKAIRAVEQYGKDNDIQKFIKGSGLQELYPTEQKNALELLAQDKVPYGIEGMDAVSGGEAAAREIARLITLGTHFRYRRFQRAPIEMGTGGRVLGSLATFPRGVGQKLYRHFEKASPRSKAPPGEKNRALRSLIMTIIGTTMAGEVYTRVTGKEHNSYNLLNVLTYGPGGLAVGAITAIADIYGDITGILLGDEFSRDELTKDLPRLGDMFIPFYGQFMNVLETLTNQKYIDRKLLREVRAILDPKYKSNAEFYEQDRTLIGILQHAIFGGEPDIQDPIVDATGDLEWDLLITDYYNSPSDKRYDYRKSNPHTDAALFINGNVSTLQSTQARDIVRKIVNEYKIDTTQISGWTNVFGGGVPKPSATPQKQTTPSQSMSQEGYDWAKEPLEKVTP